MDYQKAEEDIVEALNKMPEYKGPITGGGGGPNPPPPPRNLKDSIRSLKFVIQRTENDVDKAVLHSVKDYLKELIGGNYAEGEET